MGLKQWFGNSWEWNIQNIAAVFVLAIVMLQGLSILVTNVFDVSGLKLGPVFVLIAVSSAIFASFVVIKNYLFSQPVSKRDTLTIIILVAVAVLAALYLPKILPEIFEPGRQQLFAAFNP